ncbi:hypothetical protein [Nitratireductor pacificus]|uniref:Uncharacterized protein n=1 Tax=Nitratireductor pacificus pht-3B TaxID=391937 RepID=K2M7A8_9HYPH|nr:hypothetical protein [Nitratireductor pacificus]EKF18061.1 hypothetical protein NA2_15307 [Nitratireductor pacificus pht-3B]
MTDTVTTHLNDMVLALEAACETLPERAVPVDLLFRPPEWPRDELLVMFRFLANEMELPRRCSGRRCRRLERCCGGPGRHDASYCLPHWDAAAIDRLRAASAAVMLCWMRRSAEHHALMGGETPA